MVSVSSEGISPARASTTDIGNRTQTPPVRCSVFRPLRFFLSGALLDRGTMSPLPSFDLMLTLSLPNLLELLFVRLC